MVERNQETINISDTQAEKSTFGRCPFRILTGGKLNRVIAPLCTHASSHGEGSFFESCIDIALSKDECPKLNTDND